MFNIVIDKNTPEEVFELTVDYIRSVKGAYSAARFRDLQGELSPAVEAAETVEAAAAAPPAPEVKQAVEEPKTESVTPPPAPEAPAPAKDEQELDVKGRPWDKRIHASSKAKVKDGTWRYKRGVKEELIRQVEAELANAKSGPEAVEVEAPAAPAVPPAPEAVVAPPPPPAPAVPPAPTEAAATGRSYSELTRLITTSFMEDRLDAETVQRVVQAHGFEGVPLLADQSPEKIAGVYTALEGEIK